MTRDELRALVEEAAGELEASGMTLSDSAWPILLDFAKQVRAKTTISATKELKTIQNHSRRSVEELEPLVFNVMVDPNLTTADRREELRKILIGASIVPVSGTSAHVSEWTAETVPGVAKVLDNCRALGQTQTQIRTKLSTILYLFAQDLRLQILDEGEEKRRTGLLRNDKEWRAREVAALERQAATRDEELKKAADKAVEEYKAAQEEAAVLADSGSPQVATTSLSNTLHALCGGGEPVAAPASPGTYLCKTLSNKFIVYSNYGGNTTVLAGSLSSTDLNGVAWYIPLPRHLLANQNLVWEMVGYPGTSWVASAPDGDCYRIYRSHNGGNRLLAQYETTTGFPKFICDSSSDKALEVCQARCQTHWKNLQIEAEGFTGGPTKMGNLQLDQLENLVFQGAMRGSMRLTTEQDGKLYGYSFWNNKIASLVIEESDIAQQLDAVSVVAPVRQYKLVRVA